MMRNIFRSTAPQWKTNSCRQVVIEEIELSTKSILSLALLHQQQSIANVNQTHHKLHFVVVVERDWWGFSWNRQQKLWSSLVEVLFQVKSLSLVQVFKGRSGGWERDCSTLGASTTSHVVSELGLSRFCQNNWSKLGRTARHSQTVCHAPEPNQAGFDVGK